MTIGRIVITGNEVVATPQYVKTFKVSYSLDGISYQFVTDPVSLTEVSRYISHSTVSLAKTGCLQICNLSVRGLIA